LVNNDIEYLNAIYWHHPLTNLVCLHFNLLAWWEIRTLMALKWRN